MEGSEDRLRGFCSITFDDSFVVRDLKIIQGNNGPFVAMPSRKLTSNCPRCRTKNHLRSNYCNNCGEKLKTTEISTDTAGRAKLYADIAHPVNARCREMIQNKIIEELNQELELAAQPGYRSRYDEDYDDEFVEDMVVDVPASTNPATEGKSERTDEANSSGPAPHDPPASEPDVSSGRSKPSTGEFGNGIF
jgi:stage V sporulation protein G